MDAFTFTSSLLTLLSNLINATAWPFAFAFILISFRKEIRDLIPSLSRVEVGWLKVEFTRRLLEAKELEVEISDTNTASAEPEKILLNLARKDPRSAVLKAWADVEMMAKRAATHNGGSPLPDVSTGYKAMNELSRSRIVSPEEAELFHKLRGLYHQALLYDTMKINEELAREYVHLATTLEEKLHKLASLH